jgi:hypothetical protein
MVRRNMIRRSDPPLGTLFIIVHGLRGGRDIRTLAVNAMFADELPT